MNSGTTVWILIAVCSICILKSCYSLSFDYKGARIVTYGEPCATTRRLPFDIEGPKPPPKEEKIPVSMNFKIVSDMYVQPRRVEYPIAIEMPCPTSLQSEKIVMEDTLRGRAYAYNTYIPPPANLPSPLKSYNYDVEVPMKMQHITHGCKMHQIQRLEGLRSKIDRVLVPACEVSSSASSPCQCQYK
ncbi:PREDICTED: uncharacterized protein LOC108577734 [Habropoda laboriosa]|uniref:uncharacterized protein LOC108577734 n=1 Tax=Habropoda laboriosa TaxID=597456 RepID=UPI00083E06A2|nr:PREDICTED: uncharacterized protein LOC108577734 [Habropoda laboriosa]